VNPIDLEPIDTTTIPAVRKDKMRVSVIIPSHNRPHLVREAIESVRKQTFLDWEIIVIDDGSVPPANRSDLRAVARREITVLRNDFPLGQAVSREKGEKVATGEFILHLDDDDLLASKAIESGISVLDAEPEIDVVFLNVMGFGERASAFHQAQKNSLDKVLKLAEGLQAGQGVIRFGKSLFSALLQAVPMAFQRPMARRNVWRDITGLRRKAYGPDHPLGPPLRESEWALYAAATRRIALITDPLYLQRCDGQGFFSIGSRRETAERARVQIFETLLSFAEKEPAIKPWRYEIKGAMARCYFERAYACLHRGEKTLALQYLFKASRLQPSSRCLRLGLQLMLPKRTETSNTADRSS